MFTILFLISIDKNTELHTFASNMNYFETGQSPKCQNILIKMALQVNSHCLIFFIVKVNCLKAQKPQVL